MSTTDGPGGGGSTNADGLSLEQMIAIAKADKSNNERTREQAEGAKLAEEVLADMHRVLSEKTKELKKNFSSPADGALYNSLEKAIPSLKDASTSAGDLKSVLDDTADTVDRNYEKMSAYEKEQSSLDSTDPQDLKQFADPGNGKDGYTTLADDILTDARNDFNAEDDKFLTHKMDISSAHPQEYTGPKWEGRQPDHGLDQTLDDYYPDDSPYGRGGNTYGSTSNASQSGGSNGPADGSAPQSPPPTHDSPQLQTPGGSNTPVTSPNPTAPGTPPPTGGGNVPPAPFVPGGANTTNLPGKTVSPPPTGQRPVSGNPTARPTPGMTRPLTGPQNRGIGPNATGRPTGPMSNRGYNATPKNSLLPNQRQAASGRTPVTGSGRMPNNTNATGNRGVNTGARGAMRSGPSGVPTRKPNSGFEEQLYRNTRTSRAVPEVIGGRQGTGSPSPSNGRAGAPRVSGAGKVFGQRANKGRPSSQAPKVQSGSLTSGVRKSKKDTRHTWQRSKPEASTSLPSGSLAVTRVTGERPTTAEEKAAAALAKRRAKRRELWKRQERGEAIPIPASELFGGTEGKITRSVISGTKPLPPVDRSEVGKRFSTYGFED